MANLVSYSIPNLIQGISQQPDALREPSQGEVQINGMSSLSEGLRKREGTEVIAKLAETGLGDAYFHPILRDEQEKYLVIIASGSAKVFSLDGVEQTVSAPSGFGYVATGVPKREIRAATIADYTFISNTTKIPAMSAATAPIVARPAAHEALIWVKAANYGQTYTANVNGIKVDVSTPIAAATVSNGIAIENRISASAIAGQIRAAFLGGAVVSLTGVQTIATTLSGTRLGVPTTTTEAGTGLTVNITGNGATATASLGAGATYGKDYLAGDKIYVARNQVDGGNVTGLKVEVATTTRTTASLNLATTTDGRGAGLLVRVNGDGASVLDVTISPKPGGDGNGYLVGDKIYVARNLLNGDGSTDTTPVFVATVTSQGNTDATPVQVATVGSAAAGPLANVAIDRAGSVLHLKSGSAITLSATDARANADITAISNSVQQFTELPTIAPKGYLVQVLGDPGNQFDDYYLEFAPRAGAGTFGEGSWVETVAPGVEYRIDPATMPHVLVRLPSGTFYFGPANGSTQGGIEIPHWGDRTAGDYTTAPDPGFIGRPIQDVFVYKNRLGVLADEKIILSRAREFFEFFPETVTTVLDSDPIESSASSSRVSILRYAIPYQDELIVFSDNVQFRFGSGGDAALTPSTAAITVLTEYEMEPDCRPAAVAGAIVFCQTNGQWSSFREFSIRGAGTSIVADVSEITNHVSGYIPDGVFRIAANETSNVWFAISDKSDYRQNIYVHKYYYRNSGGGAERVQSSWSHWRLGDAVWVLSALCVEETLYLVTRYPGGQAWLEKVPVADRTSDATPRPYSLLLDRQASTTTRTPAAIRVPAGTYNASTNQTTWTLPFAIQARTQAWTDFSSTHPGGVFLGESSTGNQITARGDWSTAPVVFGEPFEFRYRFTRFKLYRDTSGGKAAINVERVQIRYAELRYHETGYFEAQVTADRRPTAIYKYDGAILGSRGTVIGGVLPAAGYDREQDRYREGVFRVPIASRGENCVIELRNDTPHPCKFSTCEWVGLATSRARGLQ